MWKITSNQFYKGIRPLEDNLSRMIQEFSQNRFHFPDLFQIGSYTIKLFSDFHYWGVVGVGLLAALIFIFVYRYKQESNILFICISSVVSIILISGIYYLLSFDPSNNDLTWWLTSGYDRMIMPAVTLLWLSIVWIFSLAAKG